MDSPWIYLDLAPWYLNLVLGSLHYPWSMILAGVISGLTTYMTTLAGLTVEFTPIFSLVQMPGGVLKVEIDLTWHVRLCGPVEVVANMETHL